MPLGLLGHGLRDDRIHLVSLDHGCLAERRWAGRRTPGATGKRRRRQRRLQGQVSCQRELFSSLKGYLRMCTAGCRKVTLDSKRGIRDEDNSQYTFGIFSL